MKKIFTLFTIVFCLHAKAQYITITDTAFASWLTANVPAAMSGNQMDTTSSALTAVTSVNVAGHHIADLNGIQYFTAITSLSCDHNQLTSLPALPTGLTLLYCQWNQLTSLPALPNNLAGLGCYTNQLTTLPALPNSLSDIDCSSNQLTALPTLPTSLNSLDCNNNSLTAIPSLPSGLTYLDCSFNQLTALPAFPNTLANLYCQNNQLSSFPAIPNALQAIEAHDNNITCFPVFPSGMSYLTINNNPFNCLPNYVAAMDSVTQTFPLCGSGNSNGCPVATPPGYVTIPDARFVAWLQANIPSAMFGNQMDTNNVTVTTFTNMYLENDSIGDLTGVQYFDSLKILDCGNATHVPYNYMTSLPPLPSTLQVLSCTFNNLTSLPTLPNTLVSLNCGYNQFITALPALPPSLRNLDCTLNRIDSLPDLPNMLDTLLFDNNRLTGLPTLPNSLTILSLEENLFTSLSSVTLPSSLIVFNCALNNLTDLPALPNSLQGLFCQNNSITSVPALPNSLLNLFCESNALTTLPPLPNSLLELDCSVNQITCLPPFPPSLNFLYMVNNPIVCLASYPPFSDSVSHSYPLCGPTLTLTSNKYTICKGDSQLLSVSGANSYTWSPAGTLSDSLSANPYAKPNATTVYSVVGTGTSTCGSFNSAVATVTVTIPVNNMQVSSASGCAGSPATLTAGGANTYTWSTGDTTATITASPTVTTTYTVTGTDSTNCIFSDTTQITIITDSLPTVTFQLVADSTPHVYSIYAYYSANVTSAKWYWGDGTDTISMAPLHTYDSAGVYNICVTAFNACGDSVSYCQNDSMFRTANSTIIFVHVVDIQTAIPTYNAQISTLKLYPNPAQNNFTVEVSTNEKQILNIFDINGKQVLTQNIQGTTNIDASNLSQGVYNISITSSAGVINKRLVIVK